MVGYNYLQYMHLWPHTTLVSVTDVNGQVNIDHPLRVKNVSFLVTKAAQERQ